MFYSDSRQNNITFYTADWKSEMKMPGISMPALSVSPCGPAVRRAEMTNNKFALSDICRCSGQIETPFKCCHYKQLQANYN